MSLLDKQSTKSWKFRLPILQGILASLLLLAAAYQQGRYYNWFFRTYPKAFEIDYGYNPPARLIALFICGPGILIPSGSNAYNLSKPLLGISVLCVMAFWFWVGLLVDRKSRGRGPIIRSNLLRGAVYGALLLFLGFLWCNLGPIAVLDNQFGPTFHHDLSLYLSVYGLRAHFWMDFIAVLWLGGLSVLCAWQFVVSLKTALLSFRH